MPSSTRLSIASLLVFGTIVFVGVEPGGAGIHVRSHGTVATPTRDQVPQHRAPGLALPPIVEQRIDVDRRHGKPAPSANVAVQVIEVEVVGGELSIENDSAQVTLEREGERLVGTLPPVRVIDARGTHEGWTVRYRIRDIEVVSGSARRVPPGWVSVGPQDPNVVDGAPGGLSAGRALVAAKGFRDLFSAERGFGGGTYEAGAEISIEARGQDLERAVMTLAFDVR